MKTSFNLIFQATLMLTVLCCPTAQAEIYKWKDKDGTTRYSDMPPSTPGLNVESLKTRKSTPQDAAKKTDAGKPTIEPQKLDAQDQKTEQKAEGKSEAKQKACEAAKGNLEKLKAGGILYKENSKGEREYLDETAMKEEKAKAEKDVAAACGG